MDFSGSGLCFAGWNIPTKSRRELHLGHIASLPPIMCNIGHSRDNDAATVRQTVVCPPRQSAASRIERLWASDLFG